MRPPQHTHWGVWFVLFVLACLIFGSGFAIFTSAVAGALINH